MNIAQLTIELAANVARLTQDMQAARGVVERNARAMQNAADLAGKALGAIGIGLSVGAFTGFIRGAIDSADAVSKLSGRTGIAVQDIAGLTMAFEQSGLTQEDLAKSTGKLAKEMSEGGKALAAMGISSKAANGELRSTKDVLYDVADKFSGYADGASKAALAQELFGKSGSEMIPLLNGGADAMRAADEMAQKLGLTISEETAKKAEEFNDTLDTLGRGLGGIAMRVAAELLPTLSNLAGEFLESTTKGDMLKNMATALAGALKGLYSVGVGVFEVFKTVGTALGGVGAGVAALMRGDFAAANEIGNQLAKDIGASWAASGRTIQAVWKDTGSTAVDSIVKTGTAAKAQAPNIAALTAAHAKAADAAKKAAEELKKMVAEGAKLAAGLLATEGGLSGDFADKWAKMNAAYKAGAVSLADLTQAQGLLLAAQPAMKSAAEERKKQLEQEAGAWADVRAAMLQYGQAQEQVTIALLGNNKSLREEIELIGLSGKRQTAVLQQRAQAIILTKQHTLAEMARQSAITGTMTREQIALAAEIEGLQERNELLNAQEARESWTGFWASVDSTAHDTFVNVAEEGMGAFKRIGKTLKSAVLDALYQMTAKQWIVGISASGPGGAAMAGGGGGGSGLLGNLSTLGSLSSGVGLLGAGGLGMQAGFGALMSSGFAGISASVTGGMAAIASGTGAGMAAGLGTIAGALGPIALGAAAIYAIVKKFDNSGTMHMGAGAVYSADAGLQGGAGLYGRTAFGMGASAEYNSKAQAGMDSIAQGIGMALDSVAVSFGRKAGFEIATAFADDVSKDGAWGSLRISQAGSDLLNWEDSRKSKWAPKEFGDGEAGYKDYLAAVAKDTRQVLLNMDLPSWADTMLESIGEAAGIEGLTAVIQQIGAVQAAFAQMAANLVGFAGMSDTAQAALLKAAGGIEALAGNAASYYENFYDKEERAANVLKFVTAEFEKFGVAVPESMQAYRALVEEQLSAGESGAKFAAVLLQLNGQFKETQNEAEDLAEAMRQLKERDAQAQKALLESVAVSAADIGKTFRAVLLGRTDAAEAGAAIADMVTGGIYNALAGGFADQLTDLMTTQLMAPVIQAAVAGASISEAVSQSAIDSMIAQAQAAADALGQVFSNPQLRAAIDSIGEAISAALGAAGSGAKPYTPTASSSNSSGGNYAEAVKPVEDAWLQMLRNVVQQTQDATRELSRLGMTGYEAAVALIGDKAQEQIRALQDAGYMRGERERLEEIRPKIGGGLRTLEKWRSQGSPEDASYMLELKAAVAALEVEFADLSTTLGKLPPEVQAMVESATALLDARNAATAQSTLGGLTTEVARLGFTPLQKELASITDRSAEYVRGLMDLGQGTDANIAAVKAWEAALTGAAVAAQEAAVAAQATADAQALLANQAQAGKTLAQLGKEVAQLGMSGIEKEIAGIADRANEYRQSLVDLGQGTDANIKAVNQWQNAMMEAAMAAQAAADMAAAAQNVQAKFAARNSAGALKDRLQSAMGGQGTFGAQREGELWAALAKTGDYEKQIGLATQLTDMVMARQQLEVQNAARLLDFGKNLRGYVDGLKLGSLSPLTNAEKLAEAARQYQATLGQAQGGDTAAQGSLQGIASSYLDLARTYFAGNEQFAGIFGSVTQSLDALGATSMTEAQQQLAVGTQSLGELQKLYAITETAYSALDTQYESAVAQLAVMQDALVLQTDSLDQLKTLATAMASLPAEIAVRLPVIDTSTADAKSDQAAAELLAELKRLREEVAQLRTESRQDAQMQAGVTAASADASAERIAQASAQAVRASEVRQGATLV